MYTEIIHVMYKSGNNNGIKVHNRIHYGIY